MDQSLRQRVLNRRARQRKAALRRKALDGARALRRGVLDVLGLVEEDVAEFLLLVEVHVSLERVVCRHDDVDAHECLQLGFALRLRTGDGHGLKGWCKAADLLEPVVEQRGRRDDEDGRAPASLRASRKAMT